MKVNPTPFDRWWDNYVKQKGLTGNQSLALLRSIAKDAYWGAISLMFPSLKDQVEENDSQRNPCSPNQKQQS